ncbi:MAG: peptidylprolyl isomerase [Nitrospinales bacterium]
MDNKYTKINIRVWLVCLGVIVFVAGCSEDSNKSESLDSDVVVAKVNQKKINLEIFEGKLHLEEKKFRLEGKDSLKPDTFLWLKNQVLNNLIQDSLLIQEAKIKNIKISDEEFQKVLNDFRSGYQEGQFQRTLEIEEINEEEWKNRLRNNLIIKKLIRKVVHSRISVSEEDLRKYFDEHLEDFNKAEQIRALQIMVDTEAQAQDILRKLKNDPGLFSYLARKFSQGLEAVKGGDLGFLDVSQMPEEFEGVFKLDVNKISEVIQTPYGYHIFQIQEKIPQRKMSFEESKTIIKKRLTQKIQDREFSKWFQNLKQEANIEVNYKVLNEIS